MLSLAEILNNHTFCESCRPVANSGLSISILYFSKYKALLCPDTYGNFDLTKFYSLELQWIKVYFNRYTYFQLDSIRNTFYQFPWLYSKKLNSLGKENLFYTCI